MEKVKKMLLSVNTYIQLQIHRQLIMDQILTISSKTSETTSRCRHFPCIKHLLEQRFAEGNLIIKLNYINLRCKWDYTSIRKKLQML